MFSWLGIGNTWHVTPCIFLQIFHISLITRCHIAHGPQIHLFVYSFFYLLQKSIMFRLQSWTDMEKRRKFFGMILYIHFLCLYRRNFLIHTGGEQINCTVQLKLVGYTCYSRKFFGMILYIHFLCLYRRNFLIHTGGEQINCTVQLKLDGYTCYSRKPYNIALRGNWFRIPVFVVMHMNTTQRASSEGWEEE